MLIAEGVCRVVALSVYNDERGLALLKQANVMVEVKNATSEKEDLINPRHYANLKPESRQVDNIAKGR
jgi:hypothetical protein